ncbi:hypothetical protein E3U55_06245 [Filobacillus milosensis]|uniref:5,10-methylene-tetrahydrofolate dehydrogenase n=1 Tax=Filobacillus milosensis TaxID=94137 RepID=A0A4Y8IQU2_9BACI|nr:hypothetical protein [Filobacillus milosensis]TFB22834.1 hypothetical protein E3U55_06245 [Filobacillus milosensis]
MLSGSNGSNNNIKLITAPGFANDIVDEIKDELPSLLKVYIDDSCEWEINHVTDSLTGSTGNSRQILESILENIKEGDKDYLICLTDLPLFHNKKVVVSEAYEEENIAILSLPGLGSTPMVKRIRSSIIQLVSEMYFGSSDQDREQAEKRLKDKIKEDGKTGLKLVDGQIIAGHKGFEKFSPIRRETPQNGEQNIDVRFTIPSKILGAIRILTGMVRANRPWRMFPAFVKVLVVAFATGSYAVVFPTIWKHTSNYDLWRLITLTVVAILAMILWVMAAHKLWEKPYSKTNNRLRMLYNIATLFTLLISVTLFYLNLFLMFLVAVFLFIPLETLELQIGESATYVSYIYIAWTITSFATIIGGLGTALESEETILTGTYGYRQRQRYEYLKEKKDEEEE